MFARQPDDRRPDVIERAELDLAAGRPWNAANRLQSYLSDDPLNVPARLMLGEILLDMGELSAAGRALLPSERDDEPARAAIDVWLAELESFTAKQISLIKGQGLVHRSVVDQLGPIGQRRMRPVSDRVRAELERSGVDVGEPPVGSRGDQVALGCVSVGCTGLVAVFVVGLVQIVKWLGL